MAIRYSLSGAAYGEDDYRQGLEPRDLPSDANREWKVTTEPTTEPITVEELKTFARIDGTEEDILLQGFIEAARISSENYLARSLISQTITMKMDWWSGEVVKLPRPPLISITAVETLDEDDTATAYAASNYYAITTADPGQLIIRQGKTFPLNTERDHGGYQIRFIAGYGTSLSDVPKSIRTGLLLWATEIYENRVVSTEPPPEARTLFDMYRVIRI